MSIQKSHESNSKDAEIVPTVNVSMCQVNKTEKVEGFVKAFPKKNENFSKNRRNTGKPRNLKGYNKRVPSQVESKETLNVNKDVKLDNKKVSKIQDQKPVKISKSARPHYKMVETLVDLTGEERPNEPRQEKPEIDEVKVKVDLKDEVKSFNFKNNERLCFETLRSSVMDKFVQVDDKYKALEIGGHEQEDIDYLHRCNTTYISPNTSGKDNYYSLFKNENTIDGKVSQSPSFQDSYLSQNDEKFKFVYCKDVLPFLTKTEILWCIAKSENHTFYVFQSTVNKSCGNLYDNSVRYHTDSTGEVNWNNLYDSTASYTFKPIHWLYKANYDSQSKLGWSKIGEEGDLECYVFSKLSESFVGKDNSKEFDTKGYVHAKTIMGLTYLTLSESDGTRNVVIPYNLEQGVASYLVTKPRTTENWRNTVHKVREYMVDNKCLNDLDLIHISKYLFTKNVTVETETMSDIVHDGSFWNNGLSKLAKHAETIKFMPSKVIPGGKLALTIFLCFVIYMYFVFRDTLTASKAGTVLHTALLFGFVFEHLFGLYTIHISAMVVIMLVLLYLKYYGYRLPYSGLREYLYTYITRSPVGIVINVKKDEVVVFPELITNLTMKINRDGTDVKFKHDLIGEEKLDNEGVRVAGIGISDLPMSSFANSALNSRISYMDRVIGPQTNAVCKEAMLAFMTRARRLMKSMIFDNVKKPFKIKPISFDLWLKAFPISRQKQLINGRQKWTDEGRKVKKSDFIYTTHVKKEPQCMYSDEKNEEKAPRTISALAYKYTSALGPYTKAISKFFADSWGHNSPVLYASGKSGLEIGRWMYKVEKELGSCYYIENDMSRWDKTFSTEFIQLEKEIYQHLGMPEKISRIIEAQKNTVAYTRWGDKYTLEGSRKSGDSNTSIGNSLINAILHADALEKQGFILGKHYCMAVLGDDNLIVMKKQCVLQLTEVETSLKELGLDPKLKQHSELAKAEFCSGVFFPIVTDNIYSYCLAPKLGRWITRIGSTLNKQVIDSKSKEKHMSDVLTGQLYLNNNRLFKPYFSTIERLSTKFDVNNVELVGTAEQWLDKKNLSTFETRENHKYYVMDAKVEFDDMRLGDFVEARYGLDLESIVGSIEKMLSPAKSLGDLVPRTEIFKVITMVDLGK